MILQQVPSVDIATLEKTLEEEKKHQIPIVKAHFEDVVAIGQSSIITNRLVSFLNDYFLTRTPTGLLANNNYFINIHNKREEQGNKLEEKNNFTAVRTLICFSNTETRNSFMISYKSLSEVLYINFQKNYTFDSTLNLHDSKKEFSGFIDIRTYYTLAFASVIYEYLEKDILDLDVNISSTNFH